MPVPYSQDLRDRVLAACGRGMSTKQIGELFGVSPSWVRRIKQRLRDDGEQSPRPPEPKCRHTKIDRDRLVELVELHPDATLVELREMLGVDCAESAVWKALNKLGFTFKKRQSMRLNKTAPMSLNAGQRGSRTRQHSSLAD